MRRKRQFKITEKKKKKTLETNPEHEERRYFHEFLPNLLAITKLITLYLFALCI